MNFVAGNTDDDSRHYKRQLQRQLGLRFVAAVSASCSGDKPDKEESAGSFRFYGDCALRLSLLKRGVIGFFTTCFVYQSIFPA